jgi:hypothetical protein
VARNKRSRRRSSKPFKELPDLPAIPQNPPKAAGITVRANNFLLLGDRGEPRALISSGAEGVMLKMFDKQGNVRIRLGLIGDSLPTLDMYASAGTGSDGDADERVVERLSLGCVPSGSGKTESGTIHPPTFPMLSMHDRTGANQVLLAAELNGASWLAFYTNRGRTLRWSVDSDLGVTQSSLRVGDGDLSAFRTY